MALTEEGGDVELDDTPPMEVPLEGISMEEAEFADAEGTTDALLVLVTWRDVVRIVSVRSSVTVTVTGP